MFRRKVSSTLKAVPYPQWTNTARNRVTNAPSAVWAQQLASILSAKQD